jgi:hypothetical protein
MRLKTKRGEPYTLWDIGRGIVFVIMLTYLFMIFASCSKQPENTINDDKCYFACLLSDKYTRDSVFVVRDTLWIQPCLNKFWFDKEKEASLSADGLFRHCTPFVRNGKVVEMEIWTHVFDRNKITQPKIY